MATAEQTPLESGNNTGEELAAEQKAEAKNAAVRELYEERYLAELKADVDKRLPSLRFHEERQQKELLYKISKMTDGDEAQREEKKKLMEDWTRREELLKPENSEAFKKWEEEMYVKEYYLRKKAGIVYLSAMKEMFDKGLGRKPEILRDVVLQVMSDVRADFGMVSDGVALRYGCPGWEHAKMWFKRPQLIGELGSVYDGNVFFFVTPNGAERGNSRFISFSDWLDIIEKRFKENGLDFRREDNMFEPGR